MLRKNNNLRYEAYNAEINIFIKNIVENEEINFKWGASHSVTIHFKCNSHYTIVTTRESGFNGNDVKRLLGQKEGGFICQLFKDIYGIR